MRLTTPAVLVLSTGLAAALKLQEPPPAGNWTAPASVMSPGSAMPVAVPSSIAPLPLPTVAEAAASSSSSSSSAAASAASPASPSVAASPAVEASPSAPAVAASPSAPAVVASPSPVAPTPVAPIVTPSPPAPTPVVAPPPVVPVVPVVAPSPPTPPKQSPPKSPVAKPRPTPRPTPRPVKPAPSPVKRPTPRPVPAPKQTPVKKPAPKKGTTPVPAPPARLYTLVCNKNKTLNVRDIEKCRDKLDTNLKGPNWKVDAKNNVNGRVELCKSGNVYVTGRALDNKVAQAPRRAVVAALDEILEKCGSRGGSDSFPGKAPVIVQNFVVHVNNHFV